ncbi:MAG: methyltransferase domain-containing protein [Candidatus Lokiarchaeota archaeon]|nr:methyltransferase domain-containing protein [Candidatus Lokiarchaeota archaeon]
MDVLNLLKIIRIILGIGLLCFFLFFFVIIRIIRKIHQFPIPSFLTVLIDNPFRRKLLQQPKKIAERLNLRPGMKVVEIGPGKGNYTIVVAEQVKPGGMVYAIDISEDIITRLKERVREENIEYINPQIDDVYELSFEDKSIDRVLAIACLPELPDQVKALQECKRILKPDGIISLAEIILDPDYPFRKTEKRWAREAGLQLKEEFGNWFVYQFNFKKPDDSVENP